MAQSGSHRSTSQAARGRSWPIGERLSRSTSRRWTGHCRNKKKWMLANTMAHLVTGGVRQPVQDINTDSEDPAIVPEAGLLLMDLSLNVIAVDRGATGILNCLDGHGVKAEGGTLVPKEILDIVRNRKSITL